MLGCVCLYGTRLLRACVVRALFYREQTMKELMRETEEIASKRKAFREMRDLLHRANEIVNEVRDFQPSTL